MAFAGCIIVSSVPFVILKEQQAKSLRSDVKLKAHWLAHSLPVHSLCAQHYLYYSFLYIKTINGSATAYCKGRSIPFVCAKFSRAGRIKLACPARLMCVPSGMCRCCAEGSFRSSSLWCAGGANGSFPPLMTRTGNLHCSSLSGDNLSRAQSKPVEFAGLSGSSRPAQ